jgi:hypothetical protein
MLSQLSVLNIAANQSFYEAGYLLTDIYYLEKLEFSDSITGKCPVFLPPSALMAEPAILISLFHYHGKREPEEI